MRPGQRLGLGLGLAASAAVLLSIAGPATVHSDDSPVDTASSFWGRDLAAARTQARKEGKPLLVVFR